MKLKNPEAEIFVPDSKTLADALSRTTHLAVSAHQDDIEIMAYHGIVECFGRAHKWFTGVVITNGAGSPRNGLYADYTDEEMRRIRRAEQKKAACVGEYSAQALLDYSSSAVKDFSNPDVVEDLQHILEATRPAVVYTHNLTDRHDTHVASALKVIQAARKLPKAARPEKIYGCEVWRDLDWLTDEDKVTLDVESHENLALALLGVFDSQVCGGKRYDLATMGRRRANATYYASHAADSTSQMTFAMDMTPLIKEDSLDPQEFAAGFIRRFADEVSHRLSSLRGAS